MAMRADSPTLVDTNVLLAATTPSRSLHRAALSVLNDWPSRGTKLLISGQVVREYLVVATRGLPANGLGLSIDGALHNIRALRSRFLLLDETAACSNHLLRLVKDFGCEGNRIHDANLVATLLGHNHRRLVTANVRDFRRFEGLVEVIDLASVEPS